MAEDLAGATSERLKQALDSWRQWVPRPAVRPTLVRRLAGDSNDNLLVAADDMSYVVRLDRDSAHLGVDRGIERIVLADIADTTFAPPIACIGDDFLVSRFVEASHTGAGSAADPAEVAGVLLQIHATPTRLTAVLDPFAHAARYAGRLGTVPPEIDRYIDTVLARQVPLVDQPCLCHVDLIPANVVRDSRRLRVIDWEYARLCDPAWDVAVVLESWPFTASQQAHFVSLTGVDTSRIHDMQICYRLIEGLWWEIAGRHHPGSWLRLDALLG